MKKKYKFEGMTKEQIDIIGKFTQYKSASAIQRKMVEIIGDSEISKDWTYDGYIDTGKLGNEHCSMGHALRYVHFARNKNTNEEIKFGIKCISDFFEITPDKLRMIQEGFIQVNKVVDEIVEKFNNGYNFKFITDKFKSLNELPFHHKAITLLLSNGLPLPYEYEQEINRIWSKESSKRDFEEFLDKNPQYASIVVMAKMCIGDGQFKGKHPILYNRMKDIIKFLETNKLLSENQIKLLNKIIMINFEDIDNKIEMLNKVSKDKFITRGNYIEYNVFKDLTVQYENWGLSEKQIQLLDKIYNRNLKYINDIVNSELIMTE